MEPGSIWMTMRPTMTVAFCPALALLLNLAYFQDFGVRTEINMIVYARDAVVTGPLQTDIVAVG